MIGVVPLKMAWALSLEKQVLKLTNAVLPISYLASPVPTVLALQASIRFTLRTRQAREGSTPLQILEATAVGGYSQDLLMRILLQICLLI